MHSVGLSACLFICVSNVLRSVLYMHTNAVNLLRFSKVKPDVYLPSITYSSPGSYWSYTGIAKRAAQNSWVGYIVYIFFLFDYRSFSRSSLTMSIFFPSVFHSRVFSAPTTTSDGIHLKAYNNLETCESISACNEYALQSRRSSSVAISSSPTSAVLITRMHGFFVGTWDDDVVTHTRK